MAKSYKKRLEDALWGLLDEAHALGVKVQFEDPRTTDTDSYGIFDAASAEITIYKQIDSQLTAKHIHTLAHEVRHAFQFRNRMCPTHWLAQINVYHKKNKKHIAALEADADQAANEFMIKNKLPVPTDFSEGGLT
jgi:hypothetical protein